MKATGIVRRVDELGRIVIPKEVRKVLRMKEGTPIEIFMGDEGEVVLKKYSQLNELRDFSKEAVESIIAERKATLSNKKQDATTYKILKDDVNDYASQVIIPINSSGDTLGAIILFTKDSSVTFTQQEVKAASVIANFLAKQVE